MFSSSVLEIIKILLKIFFLTTNLFSVYEDEQNSVEEEQSVYLLRKSSSDDFVYLDLFQRNAGMSLDSRRWPI